MRTTVPGVFTLLLEVRVLGVAGALTGDFDGLDFFGDFDTDRERVFLVALGVNSTTASALGGAADFLEVFLTGVLETDRTTAGEDLALVGDAALRGVLVTG